MKINALLLAAALALSFATAYHGSSGYSEVTYIPSVDDGTWYVHTTSGSDYYGSYATSEYIGNGWVIKNGHYNRDGYGYGGCIGNACGRYGGRGYWTTSCGSYCSGLDYNDVYNHLYGNYPRSTRYRMYEPNYDPYW